MKSFDMNQAVEYSYYVCCLLANIKQSLQYQIIQQYFQCQMNFNYQLYVNRMNYEPYQWPPDISLAELHSRVSQQGPINQNGVKCPCCQYQSKKKFTKWLGRDINEDCSNLGSAVPAFFGLLKFYISAIFTAILINGIYPLWAMNFTCENYNLAGKDSCLKIIFFYYIDFDIELSLLVQNGRLDIAQNLVILETITYYLLILVNLGSLWYLFYMEKKEEGLVLQHTQAARNALIIGNVPQVDPQKLKQKINLQTKLQIIEIIRLKDVKKYYELFNKRNGIYYNLLSKYVESEDPKQQKKLNKTLSTLHQQLKQQKKRLAKEDFNHLLIIFKTSYMATVVHNHYTLTQFQKLRQGTKLLIEELGFSKQWSQLPLYTLKVPSVKQIKWQNVGENLKKKLVGRIKSFITAFGIIILLMFFFEEPLRYSLETHTQDPKKLSIAQKFIPVIVSFGLFAVSVVFRNYMVEISKRKNPLNQYEAAKFVLLSSMLFHIVFYIIIPVAFFSINDGIDATIKLYVISDQARTFIVMQLILCIIDIPFQVWRRRKTKCLADQRQGFKYNQQMLHKIVQYRDFPLEMRLQVMFRIWSLAMFYSFYLPYILYYMLIALIILYVLEKRNFYLHYTLRRSITLKLQKSFLVFFVNFFCIFQCYSYCFSTRSNRQFDWGMYTAAPVTFTLLVLNFVFWIIVQPYLRKQKQKQSQQLMQKLLDEKPDKQRDAYLMNWAKDVSSGYREGYDRFLSSINNQKLDDQIQDYLQSLSGDHHQTQGMQVQKIIEMAESQFDDALND